MTTYQDLLDNTDDIQHMSALISSRGAKMDEEVDQDFLDVLKEEGYRVEEVA